MLGIPGHRKQLGKPTARVIRVLDALPASLVTVTRGPGHPLLSMSTASILGQPPLAFPNCCPGPVPELSAALGELVCARPWPQIFLFFILFIFFTSAAPGLPRWFLIQVLTKTDPS